MRSYASSFLILLALFSSWFLGGRLAWVEWSIIGANFLFLIGVTYETAFGCFSGHETLPFVKSPRNIAFRLIIVCLGLFLCIESIRLFNPMYESIHLIQGRTTLMVRDYVSWLPTTVYLPVTLKRSFLLFSLILLSISFQTIHFNRAEIRKILWVLHLNGCVMAIIGSLVNLSGSTFLLGFLVAVNSRFFGSFYYANHYCAWQIMNLSAGVVLFFYYQRKKIYKHRRGTDPRPLLLVTLFFILLSIPLSASRSGTLLLGLFVLAVSIYICLKQFRRLDRVSGRQKHQLMGVRVVYTFLAITIASLLVSFLMWYSWDNIGPRIEQSIDEVVKINEGKGNGRYLHFRDSYRVFLGRPITGWGLDSYQYVLPQYAGPEWGSRINRPRSGLDAAHTDILQYLAELGLISFLLINIPLVLSLFNILYSNSVSAKWLVLGILLVCFMALFEFPLRNPAVLSIGTIYFVLANQFIRSRVNK